MSRLQIRLNGQPREVDEQTSVADLLRHLQWEGKPCAVEVNRQLVPRESHALHQLKSGDELEIVTLVGGG